MECGNAFVRNMFHISRHSGKNNIKNTHRTKGFKCKGQIPSKDANERDISVPEFFSPWRGRLRRAKCFKGIKISHPCQTMTLQTCHKSETSEKCNMHQVRKGFSSLFRLIFRKERPRWYNAVLALGNEPPQGVNQSFAGTPCPACNFT